MINAQKTQNLPRNIGEFVTEIGAALRAMYGAAAEAAYVAIAESSYAQLIQHPEVHFWSIDAADSPGILMAIMRKGVAHLTLLHVLESARDRNVEDALIQTAARDLQEQGVRGILGEFVQHRPLAVTSVMSDLGFTKYDRQMMIADIEESSPLERASTVTGPCGASDTPAARVLVEAYQDHPSRPMHPETHDEENAKAFLKAYRDGLFGRTERAFYRVFPRNGACEAIITGAEAAPGVGFILHVAAAPRSQGRGLGSALIRETTDEFRRAGYKRMVLGVTCGNPAERLYTRMGFKPFMPVETYVWWANPSD